MCIEHYDNAEIWIDDLSPNFVQYWKRKHDCLKNTGVPFGREYCDDIKNADSSWDIKTLYFCYLENGVVLPQEYCDTLFGQEETFDAPSFLACYMTYALPKSERFCLLTIPTAPEYLVDAIDSRIDCFSSIPLENRLTCEHMYNSTNFFNFDNQTL